jgi:hypothetical protein
MSYVGPMNLIKMLQEIHTLFSNGIDYPGSTEEDYKVRVALINSFIRVWSRAAGVKWRQLYDVKASQMIAAEGDSSFVCDDQFRRLGGKVKLILAGVTFDVPVFSQERLDGDDLPATYCYVSGKPGAYYVNFVGVPAAQVGATIRYRFYRFPTLMTAENDVPDMADPNFIIFSVVSRLFQLTRNNTGYTIYFNDAQEALESMTTENMESELEEEQESIAHRIHNIGTMGS